SASAAATPQRPMFLESSSVPDRNRIVTFDPGGDDNAQAACVDVAGDFIAFGGLYGSNLDLGDGPLGDAESFWAYFAVLDRSLNVLWSQVADAGPALSFLSGCHVREDGVSAFAINFTGDTEYGAPTSTGASAGGEDIVVASYDVMGGFRWSVPFLSSGVDVVTTIDSLSDGAFVVSGTSGDPDLTVGGVARAGEAFDDAMLAVIEDTGVVRRVRVFGGSSSDFGWSHAIGADDSIYWVGEYLNTIDFDGRELTSAGSVDIFVARLDASLNVTGARSFGGTGTEFAGGITVDDARNVVWLGGDYVSEFSIDGSTIPARGEAIFLHPIDLATF
ncbi:MAG: hypothetical protein AAF658_06175, partial [Myxococcota bacterium]